MSSKINTSNESGFYILSIKPVEQQEKKLVNVVICIQSQRIKILCEIKCVLLNKL